MRWRSAGLLLVAAVVIAVAAAGLARGSRVPADALRQQVFQAERGFAATMKARDFDAFTGYLSREAVFMSPAGPQRGKEAVAVAWRPYFDKPDAPFSWEPDQVEVLDSGTLAFSSGPVRDPSGKQVGRFNSVWRLEGPGTWRVVFDRGCDCGR
ncbi:nuclear transport factor 2 family protein [Massilia sp. Dwa41.01b]|uniref:YybH family protein n=1 Tax=Massilia sp. Dwa41.01b TaxID=2709302 RepID=UPI0015FFCD87|nr:nuclear transport factor 2 family protein [Massilia sp. Dwa41.01b]QNA88939.1 nuclear transport factor 2 family protein [Massilia sp. Dwa41.01b]